MIVNLWKKFFRQKCDFWENSVIKNSIYDRQHPVKKLTAGSWCSMREVWLFLCKKNQAFIGWSFFLCPAVPFQFCCCQLIFLCGKCTFQRCTSSQLEEWLCETPPVQLWHLEGAGVVVEGLVGHLLGHRVGDVQAAQQPLGPVARRIRVSLKVITLVSDSNFLWLQTCVFCMCWIGNLRVTWLIAICLESRALLAVKLPWIYIYMLNGTSHLNRSPEV